MADTPSIKHQYATSRKNLLKQTSITKLLKTSFNSLNNALNEKAWLSYSYT